MLSPRDALLETRLFSALSEEVREALLPLFSRQTFHDESPLFHQGDVGDTLFLLLSGQVRVVREVLDGRCVTLALRQAGTVIGEMALIDGHQRSASVYAVEEVETLCLARTVFYRFLESNPAAYQGLLVLLCQRLRESDQKIEDLGTKSLRQRLAGTLLDLATDEGRETEDGVLLTDLVNYQLLTGILCTNRESVSRAARELINMGLVDKAGRQFVLLNLQGLADLYEAE